MEVSTTPVRWRILRQKDSTEWRSNPERDERASRTHVKQLQYLKSGLVKEFTYYNPVDLVQALREIDDQHQLRLFVVEEFVHFFLPLNSHPFLGAKISPRA